MKKYLSNPFAIVVFITPALLIFSIFVLLPILQVFLLQLF